jgi:TonB family protein
MNIPEEFGQYLLLKKLTEDPLGETFRGGRVGKEGVEQVVLLRVFNGKGLNLDRLGAAIANGAAVQAALKSPNIGNGVDIGRVRNFPYIAYDYISGKSLASLFAQSASQHSPIPTDHALLIAERLSLALAAAYESRVRDERLLHGFVVPHLVMVSNEGETRLLGFEVGPGLRDLAAAGWRDEALIPYLAPEALAGAPLGKQDDVFSCGAILYELLTGARLPKESADGYASAVDSATLAPDGTPLPAPLAALLKKSLAPRDQRISDALTWHKTLSKLMIDGHFSPTTFNLAFFMHSLFRDDIERENRELQAEKKIDLPKPAAAAKPAPPAAKPAAAPAPAPRDAVAAGASVAPMAATARAERKGKGLWIGIGAVVVLGALGAGGWYYLQGSGKKPAPAVLVPPPAPAPAPGLAGSSDTAAPAAPAQSQEAIQAQIQQMFEARSKEMETKLREQYDQRIKQLQGQLDDSRKSGAETSRFERTPPQSPPPAVEERPARQEPPAPVPSAPAPQQSAPPPSTAPAEKPAAPVTPPAPVPAPERRQPQTQVGDLVRTGDTGVVNARALSKPEPIYPGSAQKLNRAAQIDIKVLVDERGRVVDAEQIGGKAGFGFDEAALAAAKRVVFQPATKDGVRVKIWYTMRVTFKPRI